MKSIYIMSAVALFTLNGCSTDNAADVAKAKADADAAKSAQVKAEVAQVKAEADLAKMTAELDALKKALGPRNEVETKLIGSWTGGPSNNFHFGDMRFRADGTCDLVKNDLQFQGLKYRVIGTAITIDGTKVEYANGMGLWQPHIQEVTASKLVLKIVASPHTFMAEYARVK